MQPLTPKQLTERQQRVLWATVHRYIATAEPVGSKALVDEYNLNVSSATIRNIMGLLERSGLLYQPHTSAGRVPSDSGYRIYVDSLLIPDLEQIVQLEQLLLTRLNPGGWSLEAILRGAAQILSMLSGYITLITLPQSLTATIRLLQLVRVESARVMLIVVTDSYETQSTLLDLPAALEEHTDEQLVERELALLANFLNHHLQGRSLGELQHLNWQELIREFQQYADFLRSLLTELARRAQPVGSPQILISGLSEVLQQPEFSELQQLQTILHLLEEEQEQLWPLICEWSSGESSLITTKSQTREAKSRARIRIGTENLLEPIRTCALVSSAYQRGGNRVGSVGVLGPTRMAYEKVIPLVEATAEYLSESLSATGSLG